MEKELTKIGNSSALVLDKVLMELIGIRPESTVKLTIRGDELVIRAAESRTVEARAVDEPVEDTEIPSAEVSLDRPKGIPFEVVNIVDGFDSTAHKKRAFLIGDEPKAQTVHTLLKMALYRGQSINAYDLVTGKHLQQWNNVKGDPRMSSFRDYWIENGHEVEHPNDIPYADAKRWVEHGRKEARDRSLEIKPTKR
jgi:antitoxin component of MazEF toxin-antitoxin module